MFYVLPRYELELLADSAEASRRVPEGQPKEQIKICSAGFYALEGGYGTFLNIPIPQGIEGVLDARAIQNAIKNLPKVNRKKPEFCELAIHQDRILIGQEIATIPIIPYKVPVFSGLKKEGQWIRLADLKSFEVAAKFSAKNGYLKIENDKVVSCDGHILSRHTIASDLSYGAMLSSWQISKLAKAVKLGGKTALEQSAYYNTFVDNRLSSISLGNLEFICQDKPESLSMAITA